MCACPPAGFAAGERRAGAWRHSASSGVDNTGCVGYRAGGGVGRAGLSPGALNASMKETVIATRDGLSGARPAAGRGAPSLPRALVSAPSQPTPRLRGACPWKA